jgi:predicted AlkP superfamily phosphohydrolase/phosphomutase/Flp pilus assembly protein TadD
MMSTRKAKKLLIVGWDAADWKIINPLLDSGQMPALERLVNGGVMGNIATLDPPLSPMLWTSIATGKTADKHGILNFVEPHPEKAEIRPISSTTRKVKAFWNILNQEGLKCNIVGWWPSNPAEPINGAMVSNLYPKPRGPVDDWPLYPGSVHPASLQEAMAGMRIHPSELTMNHISPFIPKVKEIFKERQEKDKIIEKLALFLAEAASIHNAATWLMENTEWDVTAVYYDAIDITCHNFMRFHPPQIPGIPDDIYENYKDVVTSMYRFHDMMLERLLELAGEDTTVILLSDHGFHSDHLRPKALPKEPDAPALEHRQYGILCMNGPGILKDERVYGATLLDITPTILTLFGLPVGADMDGKALVSIFEEETTPSVIPSWEDVEGESGMHPEEVQEDPIAAQEALRQLVELGYIEAPGEDAEKTVRHSIALSLFNLARVHMGNLQFTEALPILEKLHKDYPEVQRYGLRYASCLQRLKKMEECRAVINTLRLNMNQKEFPQLDFLEGSLLLSENNPRKALACFVKAEKAVAHQPFLHIQIGAVYSRMQRWADAVRAYTRALEIDAEHAGALLGRGVANLRLDQYEQAVEDLLDAVGLVHHQPQAHFYLGEALYWFGDYERAIQAFQVSISMEPGLRRAYAWLVKIYGEKLQQPEQEKKYKEFMEKNIKGTVTIVSGLPRSGTSMMMQMLKAGGLDILTDNIRKEDDNNPKGYLEYEKAKKLASDNSWMAEANGKTVKVITQLLHFLPPAFNYKVIYMVRDMNEVLRSQQVMLGKDPANFNTTIAQAYQQHHDKSQAWLKAQPHIEVLHVNYADAVNSPREVAENIASFLGTDLDLDAMEKAVDSALYRNKVSPVQQ